LFQHGELAWSGIQNRNCEKWCLSGFDYSLKVVWFFLISGKSREAA
jgi:hypothetical protein